MNNMQDLIRIGIKQELVNQNQMPCGTQITQMKVFKNPLKTKTMERRGERIVTPLNHSTSD